MQVFIFNFINTHWILDIYFKAGAIRIQYDVMTNDAITYDIIMYDVLVITLNVMASMKFDIMTLDVDYI